MDEIEKIRFDEEIIRQTADWWSKEIKTKGEQLKEKLSNNESSYKEIEELQKQIEALQKKGFEEQQFIERHEEKKKQILRNYLISGCLHLNLNYSK